MLQNYLLFLPEFPKIFTHYSSILFLIIPLILIVNVSMIIMSTMHMVSIILKNRVFPVQTFLQNLCIAAFMFTIIIILNNFRDNGHCSSQLFLYYARECPIIPE